MRDTSVMKGEGTQKICVGIDIVLQRHRPVKYRNENSLITTSTYQHVVLQPPEELVIVYKARAIPFRPFHATIETFKETLRSPSYSLESISIHLTRPSYTSSLVTFENSPFCNFVSQKIGFVSKKPCLTHPSSLTWYKLIYPPE